MKKKILRLIIYILCVYLIIRVIWINARYDELYKYNYYVFSLIISAFLSRLSINQKKAIKYILQFIALILQGFVFVNFCLLILTPYYYKQGFMCAEVFIIAIALYVIQKNTDDGMNQISNK